MRNAKRCGCSFSQSDADFTGERIQVNNANSCGCGSNHCHCQDSCRPKPCPPRPCPPRPCRPKPCPPRPCPPRPCRPRPCPPRPCPSCEDRCASQYRNCMRNCRCEQNNNHNNWDMPRASYDGYQDPYSSYGYGDDGMYNRSRGYEDEQSAGFQDMNFDSYEDSFSQESEE